MKFLIAALLVGSGITAFAQSGSVGSVSAVQGNVVITSSDKTSKAILDADLKNGDVVAVSSEASATLKIRNCTLSLTSGQSVVIDSDKACAALIGSVKTITQSGTILAGFPGGAVGMGVAIVGGGLIIREVTKSDKASGS